MLEIILSLLLLSMLITIFLVKKMKKKEFENFLENKNNTQDFPEFNNN